MGSVATKTWRWTFDRPVDQVWPILADTVRFNEAAGLPKHVITEANQEDGTVLFSGTAQIGRFNVTWREEPCNWVTNRWFRHRRVFENGPFKSLCATLEFSTHGTGCRGDYTLEVEPANLLGRAILLGGFFRNVGKTFARLAAEANEFATGQRPQPFTVETPPASEETTRRVDRMVADIEASEYGHGLARKLADLVLAAPQTDLTRIQPLALAHAWRKPERDVVDLCLKATIVGLLEVRWDLLCPRCRGAKVVADSLDKLPSGGHCSSCNIDYDRDFAKNIELCFRPAKSIRPIDEGEFCLFGPMSTPHVMAQITVPPGECRQVSMTPTGGPLRVRTVEPGPQKDVDFPGGAMPRLHIGQTDVRLGDLIKRGVVHFVNELENPRTLIIEDRRWAEEALTANKATYLQSFRDLFSDQVLRPGDEVAIERVALMFSDLRGSTALYEDIGEAAAYQLVRKHFAFLTKIIRDHDGAVVKTIGDAIMAAFAKPASAVAAALEIQNEVDRFNAETTGHGMVIKLGIHDGPSIAVTLNGRLDYFGSTVNKAARLQGCSIGGDVVISQDSASDPEVSRLLIGHHTHKERAALKGFDRSVDFVRVSQIQPLITANEA